MGFDVLVFAEQREGHFKKSLFECLSLARRLAGDGGRVHAVLPGDSVAEEAATLHARGADVVHVAEDPALRLYNAALYARACAAAFEAARPSVVLLAATAMGRDLAPRIAARWGVPWISEALEVERADSGLRIRKSMVGGKVFATVETRGEPPYVVTVRPGAGPAAEADAGRRGETKSLPVPADPLAERARVTGVEAVAGETVDLHEAEVVVSGGRGLKAPEHFALIRDLAEAVGGAVGASRAVVDAGWIDHQHQVGQTGATVSPKLYFACGISGAIQHLAGMRTSSCIVAINKDPDAPIFKVADYGIVGDVFEVIPVLIEEIRKARSS